MAEPASNEKYFKGQRVFAKDHSSGILYKAVVRRTMHGIARQPRQKMSLEKSDDDEEEAKPEWHCFVHYLGWNVKWDRWVSEEMLYEINDKTTLLAQKIQEAVREVKKKYRNGPQVMIELHQRTKRLEQEQRQEERREELAKQGISVEESDQKLTKAQLKKELSLRKQGLEGRRKQAHVEKLAMPFSNILVEEWEVITQCNMMPVLPAKATVQQVLEAYLTSKIGAPPRDVTGTDFSKASVGETDEKTIHEPENSKRTDNNERGTPAEKQVQDLKSADAQIETDKHEAAPSTVIKKNYEGETPTEGQVHEQGDAQVEIDKDAAAPLEVITSDREQQESQNQDSSTNKKQKQEWKDMVDGIALLFDQAIDKRLLYRQEVPHHKWIQQQQEFASLRYCQIYGCEHLLRLFLRLPGMIEDETESRRVFPKLNDLMRYLQKHQSTIFLQSYYSWKRDVSNTTAGRTKKRKRKPMDSPSPHLVGAAEESSCV